MSNGAKKSLCLYSAESLGLDVPLVEIEVHVSNGLPRLDIVGLAETAVQESRQRVRSAIMTSGWTFPDQKITINLAPTSIKKTGTGLDLAMALGILCSSGLIEQCEDSFWQEHLLIGELGLSGKLRPISGILNVVTMAKARGLHKIILPVENTEEAALIQGLALFPARDLREVVEHVEKKQFLPACKTTQAERSLMLPPTNPQAAGSPDLGDIKGQTLAKSALLVAAAGGHNLLFVGPPGAGKTFLARSLPGILPPLSEDEAIETTRIYSSAGFKKASQGLIREPPFRAPHHSISDAGLVGGGKYLQPGEISLAHNGVLFLDELPEFRRNVLELLREPLETGTVHLARAAGVVTYPAHIQMIAAMNPCPCGYANGPDYLCRCAPLSVQNYRKKISGPLLDRLDLRLFVHPVSYDAFFAKEDPQDFDSSHARAEVARVRSLQLKRFAKEPFKKNADIPTSKIKIYCELNDQTQAVLQEGVAQHRLSARGTYRLLRVARTLADLDTQAEIGERAVLKAFNFCHIPTQWQVG